MADYNYIEIEKKWQAFWEQNATYKTETNTSKPKYYVLDMFPYPSGAGLHVGHPLGYIASDIISRYKRFKGFNVLHPMGFDSFGLPAEQYAIQTGQHPAITTQQNIATFTRQLKSLGFSYDWSKEVRTSDPAYYKWTQWIFMQLFNSWYNIETDKAEPIYKLVKTLESSGNETIKAVCDEDTPVLSASQWNGFSEDEKQMFLFKYRLTFPDESYVNWCAGLGSVLSNDEVKDGLSERGGYPVEQKLMKQWAMRITAYAHKLIDGLNEVDWSESIKDQQRNWIGRSKGASVKFALENNNAKFIEVFTTRVDTIFGVSFMVLAPEHEWVAKLTTTGQQTEVTNYLEYAKNRSELERTAEVKKVSGVFTGSFCVNPFNNEKVPIYLADYVLAGYGTGAVMGVPSGDQRDWNFATHFNLPIIPILDGQKEIEKQADNTKEGKYINSGFINGMTYEKASDTLVKELEERGIGKGKTQYRLRNAVFSRQRYWGEPVPVYFKNGVPYLIEESELPLVLPDVDKYLPTPTGEPPLGNAQNWKYKNQHEYELSTMPGWAGSSWYWYRYMDNTNETEFAGKEAMQYWQAIDLYMGGSEHATGHLLYSRFWNHFLYDLGLVPQREFAKKLINQGMIQGRSNFAYRLKAKANTYVSFGLKDNYETNAIHVDVNIVENDVLDIEKFKASRLDLGDNPEFILENGKYMCGWEVEKMSKSKYNVVNPEDITAKYGTDTLRIYEMFLGPLEQAKPWNTNGITGSFNFLKKVWRLFIDDNGNVKVTDKEPTKEEQKVIHGAIKKVTDEIERYSFNTVVSSLMITANELSNLKCTSKEVLEKFVILLSPYAPHIAEELFTLLGHGNGEINKASWPIFDPKVLEESTFEYPVSINGKVRATLALAVDMPVAEIEAIVLQNEAVQKWLNGAAPKKIIVVPKRIINVVV